MGFFKKTIYKTVFLKEDVAEILYYYENQDKEKLTQKYSSISSEFYQEIFNELIKQIPISDALKLLNFKAIMKNKEELKFSWEYTEEKRKELYNEIREEPVVELEKEPIQTKKIKRYRLKPKTKGDKNEEKVIQNDCKRNGQIENESVEKNIEIKHQEKSNERNHQEVVQIKSKKDLTEEIGKMLFGE